MSDPIFLPNPPTPVPSPPRDPRAAIAVAAQKTGANFNYLLAQARLESGLDPTARASTSSAAGLYQFINSTWLQTLDRHGERLGLGAAAGAIHTEDGTARITNNANRGAIMALKLDPAASALMAGALANDNREALAGVLGREPDAAELYMAHFLGAAGASKFLRNLAANPETSAAAILPKPAAANRAIFYKTGGAERSVGEVMQLMRGKMARAMAQDNGAMPVAFEEKFSATTASNFLASRPQFIEPLGQWPAQQHAPSPLATTTAQRRPSSMSDTLKNSFDFVRGAMPARAQSQVSNAYARLKAFDL